MADLYFTVPSGTLASEVVAKTLVMAQAPANQRLRVCGWKISYRGVNPNQLPILTEIVFDATNAGGGLGLVAGTTSKWDKSNAETIATAPLVNLNAHVTEPTGGHTDFTDNTPAAGGSWEVRWPPGQGPIVPGGSTVGIRVTADTTTLVNAELYLNE